MRIEVSSTSLETGVQPDDRRIVHRAAGRGVHGRRPARGERRRAHRRRRQARHQVERLAVCELRRRVLLSQPELCRQGWSQGRLVAWKAESISTPMEGAKPDDPADAELDLAWPMRRSSKSLEPWTSLEAEHRPSPAVAVAASFRTVRTARVKTREKQVRSRVEGRAATCIVLDAPKRRLY